MGNVGRGYLAARGPYGLKDMQGATCYPIFEDENGSGEKAVKRKIALKRQQDQYNCCKLRLRAIIHI